ncbi:MAG: DNA methyltransferase [Planctomycetales bacterium]
MPLDPIQLSLFEDDSPAPVKRAKADTSSTFVQNTKLPVHRWFRFSAGFSATWAESVIRAAGATRVLDPFAGSGTTLLAAEDAGADALGVEAHPFIYRVASAKLQRHTEPEEFLRLARKVRATAAAREGSIGGYPSLVTRCFPSEVLEELDVLRGAVEDFRDDTGAWQLCWMALVGILRTCSPVGTAQWQYVLPKKEKKNSVGPFAAFDAMTSMIAADLRPFRSTSAQARVLEGDARELGGIPNDWADLVVTSPPYPNNYDYADATRLEMCFFREIDGWGDLQKSVRQYLVRACSQHVPERSIDLYEVLDASELHPIRDPLTKVCEQLAEVRKTRGGKKTYHLMVACYFHDLARTWLALRRTCAPGARACFVIGDSAPYGVYVPVDEWLGELALAAGFRSWTFERTRDRNVKWKNRKHRVPLCEGRLWVEG